MLVGFIAHPFTLVSWLERLHYKVPMDVTDRFALGLEDRSSAWSSRPARLEPEQLSGPYEPELSKVGPESGGTR